MLYKYGSFNFYNNSVKHYMYKLDMHCVTKTPLIFCHSKIQLKHYQKQISIKTINGIFPRLMKTNGYTK